MSVVIETTIGAFTVDLYTSSRPKLCKNFLKLCKVKFYNFCLFHNVQPNFMAQTGDPTGTGRGGESVFRRLFGEQAKYFDGDEDLPRIRHTKKGSISMVGAGDNMFGSQFIITLDDDIGHLDGDNRVFGQIADGFEMLEKLNEVIVDDDHRPYQDVRVTHTVVLDDPFDDPQGLEVPPSSPLPDPEMLKTDRLAADEDVEDDDGVTVEEQAELNAEKEAKAQATILEMIGDLPEADCAPPENVLFVCKLNPVTSDDDLEIIFSRFGRVVSCEVIRDRKSGDSLQYAFCEFEDRKACEAAYFKMDNVLIDDRRIHVDFSQSVSKFQWKGKGRLEVKEGNDDRNRSEDKRPAVRQAQVKDKPRYYPAKRDDEYEKKERSPKRRPSPSPERKRKRSRSVEKRRQRSRSRERKKRSRSRSRSKERRRQRSRDNKKSSSSRGGRDDSSDEEDRDRKRKEKKRDRSRSRERKRRSRSRERRRR
jgi:peptidyl-prolyl cis-trans isomerase-like 4